MNLEGIIQQAYAGFSFVDAFQIYKPLILFILGIIAYSVFVFNFYRLVAKRDIFELNLKKYSTSPHPTIRKMFAGVLYFIEHIVIFPFLSFFWFAVLSLLLAFLSKDGVAGNILLTSIALVGAIRAVSYYTEDLSNDLAKLVPFALLAVFLADINYFSLQNSISVIIDMILMWEDALYYLLFIVLLEVVMRFGYLALFKRKDAPEEIYVD